MGVGGGIPLSGLHGVSCERRLRSWDAGMGLLFPAFSNRSTDVDGINLYSAEGKHEELVRMFMSDNLTIER